MLEVQVVREAQKQKRARRPRKECVELFAIDSEAALFDSSVEETSVVLTRST